MKISKELFETIMNEKIIEYRGVFGHYISGTYNNRINLGIGIDVVATDGGIVSDSINDFFFKCKYWAIKQGYYLESSRYSDEAYCKYFTEDSRLCGKCGEVNSITIHAESEQQAVFDACQWILENKGIK